MNSFYSKLKEDDKFLNHLFNNKEDNLLNIFYLINRIINNIKEDTIIITPNKRELAYITSIFSSLNFFYKNYQDQYLNFEKWLVPGNYVSLVSSGKHTGTIYKYLGRENNGIKLETVPKNKKDNITQIWQKIDTILQFAPTSITQNKGNRKYIAAIPKPIQPLIDKFLNIKSYQNPILFDNKIILLNNSVERFENFYQRGKIKKSDIEYKINELINFGTIDDEGNIKNSEIIEENKVIEKNIIATSKTSSIYNYLSNTNNKKIIIGSEIKKISSISNFLQYKQIKNLKNNVSNFLIFADDNDYEEIKDLKKKVNINVFKLFDKDLECFIRQDLKKENFFSGENEIVSDLNTKVYKKIIDINVGNETFEKIDQCFENIRANLFTEEEITQEDIKIMLIPINNLRFRLRDHIFGFTKELTDHLESNLKDFSIELKSRQSQIKEKIYDNLASIINLLNSLPKDGLNIFNDRVRNFHEILKINDPRETIIYSYNIERKKYYEDNIKKKFNLEFNALTSKNSKKRYMNIIIPSEIVKNDIVKLINNSNYRNLYFLGSDKLIEKINFIKDEQINKWKRLIIDENKKVEVLNIDNSFKEFLVNESVHVKNFNIKNNKSQNIEDFLFDHGNEMDLRDDKDIEKNILIVPTIPIQLYGDRQVFLTENFETEILNPILDPYSFKNEKIKKVSNEIIEGDILLLRDSSDKDILDKETLLLYDLDLDFKEFKDIAFGLEKEIIKSFGIPNSYNNHRAIDLPNFRRCLKVAGYTGSNQTIRLIAYGETGCPDDIEDLKKILKACEINEPSSYKFNLELAKKIYSYNRKYKNMRIQAGRNITPKIYKALRLNPEISFDGDPLRVDYNSNGTISLGIETAEKPEAWIVQVQKTFGEKTVNKNYNFVNTLI